MKPLTVESELKRMMDSVFGPNHKPDLSKHSPIASTFSPVIAGQNEGRAIRAVEKPAASITSL